MAALLAAGFGLGVLLAAQIGPVKLLILRSVLRGGRVLVVGLAMAGAVALIDGVSARLGRELVEDVLGPRRAFVTAVAATALNPLTIALWTVSFPTAAPSSAASSVEHSAALLTRVALGTLSRYCGLAAVAVLARHRIGPRLLAGIDIGTGGALIAYGCVLGYRAVDDR